MVRQGCFACVGASKSLMFAAESARQSLTACSGRKVRAPAGRMPGNAWGARAHGKCHRKYTARLRLGKGEMVR